MRGMARKRAAPQDSTFADLVSKSESLPIESRTRGDRDDSLHMALSEDSWVDEAGIEWSRPKHARIRRLRKLMADPNVRVIHASWPDETTDVEPQDRPALLQAIEDTWKGRDEYYNGWQNYAVRVFQDQSDRALVVVQQWCSP
jgi:hypothetical protein